MCIGNQLLNAGLLSLPTPHCPCGDLGSTTVRRIQTQLDSSSQFLNFVLPVLNLCISIAHDTVSRATPATCNSTLGHGFLPPDQVLAATPGTAGNVCHGWNDSKQKTPNKKTTASHSPQQPPHTPSTALPLSSSELQGPG